MTAAVLCPGPSLSTHRPTSFDKYDLTVAVNRAAHYRKCDWMAAGDWVLFKHHAPPFASKLFVSEDCAKMLTPARFPRVAEFPITTFSAAETYLPSADWQWRAKTFSAALVLAAWQGATAIDVYGNDQTNEPDFDGVTVVGCERDEKRWAGEGVIVERLCGELARRGVQVRFIGPH